MQRVASILILIGAAACAPTPVPGPVGPVPGPVGPGLVPPQPSREALSAKAVAWSKAAPEVVIPASAKHLQLIVTLGWNKDERYAWLIADGKDVLVVHRTTAGDLRDYIESIARKVYSLPTNVVIPRSLVILGAYKPPPPPPPPDPPGGPIFNRKYVESVANAAWHMNRETELSVTQLSEQSIVNR